MTILYDQIRPYSHAACVCCSLFSCLHSLTHSVHVLLYSVHLHRLCSRFKGLRDISLTWCPFPAISLQTDASHTTKYSTQSRRCIAILFSSLACMKIPASNFISVFQVPPLYSSATAFQRCSMLNWKCVFGIREAHACSYKEKYTYCSAFLVAYTHIYAHTSCERFAREAISDIKWWKEKTTQEGEKKQGGGKKKREEGRWKRRICRRDEVLCFVICTFPRDFATWTWQQRLERWEKK